MSLESPLLRPLLLNITDLGRFPFDKIFETSGCKSNGTRQFSGNIPENLGQPFEVVPKSGNTENFKNSVFHLKVFSIQVPRPS